tara:strand:+ start:85 stop:411 length:327 start_codon:yes stop_codon:yes gene_type:complete
MPKINCAAEPIMPFVYVVFSFVLVYIIFFTFIRSTGLLQPDECLEILQSVDEALAEATEPNYDPLDKQTAEKEDLEATEKKEETTKGPTAAIIQGGLLIRRTATSTYY